MGYPGFFVGEDVSTGDGEVGDLSRFEGSHHVGHTEDGGRIDGEGLQRLIGWKPCLDREAQVLQKVTHVLHAAGGEGEGNPGAEYGCRIGVDCRFIARVELFLFLLGQVPVGPVELVSGDLIDRGEVERDEYGNARFPDEIRNTERLNRAGDPVAEVVFR